MVNIENGEELYHGVDILNDNIKDFELTDKPICSFQDWEFICNNNKLFKNFISYFIETVIFDAIIGNTDRHTENWAFIRRNDAKKYKIILNKLKKIFTRNNFNSENLYNYRFAPIYDSGSCLGREKSENNIIEMLKDENQIFNYILKGKSEIKWNKEELNLFEIVKKIKLEYPKYVEEKINKIFKTDTEKEIEKIIENIDNFNFLEQNKNYL